MFVACTKFSAITLPPELHRLILKKNVILKLVLYYLKQLIKFYSILGFKFSNTLLNKDNIQAFCGFA